MLKQREAKARAKLQAAMAELRRIQGMEKRQSKKQDDNRKILAGACVLEHAKVDPEFERWLMGKLEGFLTRPRERVLFGFPETETRSSTTERSAPHEGAALA